MIRRKILKNGKCHNSKEIFTRRIASCQNPDVKLKNGTIASGKKVLIDGQQRITALAAAIVGQEVVGDDYKRHRIQIAFNPQEERFDVVNPAILKDIKYISDISTIFDPSFNMFGFTNRPQVS